MFEQCLSHCRSLNINVLSMSKCNRLRSSDEVLWGFNTFELRYEFELSLGLSHLHNWDSFGGRCSAFLRIPDDLKRMSSPNSDTLELLLHEVRALRQAVATLQPSAVAPSPKPKRTRKEPRIPSVAEYKKWVQTQKFR